MKSIKDLVKKKTTVPMNDRILRIDCRECDSEPDYGNGACIKCISRTIAERGEPERIILRSGSETEYTGDAVGIMNQLSAVYSICGTEERRKGRCAECGLSPESLNDEMWTAFTITDIDKLIVKLANIRTDCDECELCINGTRRSFESVREKLDSISRDALRSAYRIMGV